ncbi:PQQ-dependent sugar dehydrogenase [Candidatus Poriferisodalis sp.]|uniref:PQQ-dependent sugar dehydrogenase n=1 Tax=Candidatus Poriferisodalis sp. TaxID=3101277 RepID=UPI003B029447
MQGGRWFSIAACTVAMAAGAMAAGCSDMATGNDAAPAVGSPDDGTGPVASAPATTLPLTQTPQYVASNTPCPAGLPELGAVPLSEAAPGRAVTLVPYIDLAEATVMVFDIASVGGSDSSADGPDAGESGAGDPDDDGTPGGGFVGDRRGRIWRFAPNTADQVGSSFGAAVSTEPVADFSSNTAAEHDQGLVGMTLGPNGRLWINRTDRHGSSVLTVLTPTADRTALEGGYADVLEVSQTNAQHNGGDLLFDESGLLYVSFGDGGGLGDPRRHGQDLTTPLGAVLRFAVDTADSDDPGDWRLAPAPGNPDLGPRSDPHIWVYGARNPFRMSFDEPTGTLWVSDVGQQCIEEVNALALDEGGANLGWNSYEGSRRFVGDELADHRPPDLEYRHGRGLCAVIGGHVYRGSELEWLEGRYVFADLCGGDIYAAAVSPGTEPDDVWHLGVSTPRPVGFAADAEGELYVIDMETGVWRLTG